MENKPLQNAAQTWGSAQIYDAHGNPYRSPAPSPASTPPSNLGGPSGPSGDNPAIDIAKLHTHVGWLTRGLSLLAVLSLAALGWIFTSVYEPMNDLDSAMAVQTEAIGSIRDDVREIKDDVKSLRPSRETLNERKPPER